MDPKVSLRRLAGLRCRRVRAFSDSLPRTPVDNERLGSLVQNTMTSEVRFRAELSGYGIERLELARA
jgi:hypothetical protein